MTHTHPEISVAPMMEWTNRHCRYFHRLLSPHAKLYTEMVTTAALLHGDKDRHLRFSRQEHPLALQLGGSNPHDLATCAQMGEDYGYDEINLNCGCPSDRVQNGGFGACLMTEPSLVAQCAEEMIRAVSIPVTIKCRIGVNEHDDFDFLDRFVDKIADKGVKTFILHARKAWLEGLSPKENREVPPLDYDRAARIKEKYPQLCIILNGGLTDIETLRAQLPRFDGAMIGREAYQNPYFLAEIEREIFGSAVLPDRDTVARAMIPYARAQFEAHGTPIKSITRHMLGLYHGLPGTKAWKQTLSTLPYLDGADETVIEEALEAKNKAATLVIL